MHLIKNVIMLIWAAGLFVSCASSKKVVYLQDVDVNKRIKAECEYKTVIHTDDLLSIIVSCDDLESAQPFNTPMIGLGREKLSEYLKNPIVTIQFQNFKVTILGEVKAPGSYKVVSERVSLLDALGMAGDSQINGKRKNVLVMREQGDEKVFARIDLTSSDFIDSPFFYLQQNDVVYVEPNKGRIAGGSVSTFLPYILSSLSTIVALISLTR